MVGFSFTHFIANRSEPPSDEGGVFAKQRRRERYISLLHRRCSVRIYPHHGTDESVPYRLSVLLAEKFARNTFRLPRKKYYL